MDDRLTLADWLAFHGIIAVVAVLVYVVTTHAMRQRRHPTAAIAWVLFILLLPYLALPAYLAMGSRKLARRSAGMPRTLPESAAAECWAAETIAALGQPAAAAYRDLRIHRDGEDARRALLDAIDSAHHSVDLCTFLIGRDPVGDAVLDALCRRAREGVRVRVLVDGLGNWIAGRPKLARLAQAGGTYKLFVPPLSSPHPGRSNLRNHRKLLVVDAVHDDGWLWCGGRNLAAEYFIGARGKPAWRDLTFDVRGSVVRQAREMFDRDWAFASGRAGDLDAGVADDAAPVAHGAQLVASGPDLLDDTVYALLVTAAYRARRSIALVTPYFVPDAALLAALCLAARRGVRVDLLLPARSNHRLSDLARNRALRALATSGGRVWLSPGMLHAKLAVVDDDVLALAGSANLDNRSFFLNYELMVAFHDAADVRRFAAWFEEERGAAHPYVAAPPGLLRDVAEGTLLWVGFQL
ncbi:MAG: phospholipase D-like domain-containing protein, partial [Gemmatimonadota bacterium]